MTKKYIEDNFSDIKNYANIIEKRLDDSGCIKEELIKDNELNLNMCKKYNCDYILIDDDYKFEVVL